MRSGAERRLHPPAWSGLRGEAGRRRAAAQLPTAQRRQVLGAPAFRPAAAEGGQKDAPATPRQSREAASPSCQKPHFNRKDQPATMLGWPNPSVPMEQAHMNIKLPAELHREREAWVASCPQLT